MIRPIIGVNFNSYTKQIPAKAAIASNSPSFKGVYEAFKAVSDEHKAKTGYAIPMPMFPRGNAEDAIKSAIKGGYIKNEFDTLDVLDFGCGEGGTTEVAKSTFYNADVKGIDNQDYYKFDRQYFIEGDGIKYLNSGEKKFDLVAACMLSPDVEVEALIEALPKGMRANGKFLAYSDPYTLGELEKCLNSHKVRYHELCTEDKGFKVIIVDKSELDARLN